jgi:hypothetical protein
MISAVLVGTGLAIAYASTRGPGNLVSTHSRVTNQHYMVQNLPDKQAAADLMGRIHQKLDTLMDRYRAPHADGRAKMLLERFNPANLCENNVNADSTSYSENKGDRIVVCLRDKQRPHPLIDENTITFVVLHELAHLMTVSVGHTPEFWANFRRILQDAIGAGIYQQVNYARTPVEYCGMTITDSPL